MHDDRDTKLELPYGRIAAWGVAVSAALTLAAVLFAPLTPSDLARRALDGPTDAGEGVAATVAGHGIEDAAAAVELDGRTSAELAEALRGELETELRTELRRELRIEMRRELRDLVERDLAEVLPAVLGRTLAPWPGARSAAPSGPRPLLLGI